MTIFNPLKLQSFVIPSEVEESLIVLAVIPQWRETPLDMTVDDLPAINASLNLLSTIFISAGWFWIRRNIWQRHVPCMIAAIITSTCFLVGYVVYHAQAGEKSSGYTGWLAVIYFPILASHVLLAFITLPLVIVTLVPVFQRRWDRHRRLGRWTMPIWLYVSVTGVLVYLMLYQWFPPPHLALAR